MTDHRIVRTLHGNEENLAVDQVETSAQIMLAFSRSVRFKRGIR